MELDPMLYTVPQWFVFAGVVSSIYGWIEHKQVFRLLGPVFFLLLSFFSLWALLNGSFASVEFLSPEEMVNEDMEERVVGQVPMQVQLFPAYLSFLISGFLAVPAVIAEWRGHKSRLWFIITTALAGLFGFFIIVGSLKSI
jgi:hypothetical protein